MNAQAYIAQLEDMAAKFRAWKAANPGKVAKVQFNFPPQVAVIATVSDALKYRAISANPDGLELLYALGLGAGTVEPSVLMVRAVLECA